MVFKKNNVVKIVDGIMGSNKTNNIIKWMDKNPQKSYIYVSPLLSEVDVGGRVHKNLKNVSLETPTTDDGTKSKSLLNMLKAGDSIACTHSLYLSMNDEHFYQMSLNDYTVIIDEEINIIGGFDRYSRSDLQWLLENNNISINPDDGMVSWVGSKDKIEPSHKYYDFTKYCDSKSLYCTKRSEVMMVSQLPVRLFECAREVIILTYMFKGNILDCFLKLKGFEVQEFDGIKPDITDKKRISELLTIVPPTRKMMDYSMSSTWYSEANGDMLKDIANYIRNTARSRGLTKQDVLWTVPKERAVRGKVKSKKLVRPVGFTVYDAKDKDDKEIKKPCWLAAQTRATNDYSEKKLMVHCYNRRPLVSVSSYLQDYGHPVDLKVFATSELLQWAWRGCIRKGEPMTLAIGSKRMYNYFMDWLADEVGVDV